ncbi:MAG: hypothetical protein WEB33_05505 [Bacteroidota bacterium]
MRRRLSRAFPWFSILSLLTFGCRDAGVVNPNSTVEGYRIEGTVRDGLEQPFNNVSIALFYSMDPINNNAPVREYTIETPGEFVNIDVYDADSVLIRNLYAGTPGGPTVFEPWDKLKNDGALVGSGVYTVRVTVGGMLRHSYVEVVNGNVTAVTNADGVFAIPGVYLPIGYSPAPVYNSAGAFVGNYRISDRAYLECNVGGVTYGYSVRLVEGFVTRASMRID